MRTQDNTLALLQAIDEKAEQCLSESGEVVVPVAKDNAPYDTGALRRSIHAKYSDNRVEIGSTVPYGDVQEISQPHLRPALHGKKLAIKRIFGKA